MASTERKRNVTFSGQDDVCSKDWVSRAGLASRMLADMTPPTCSHAVPDGSTTADPRCVEEKSMALGLVKSAPHPSL